MEAWWLRGMTPRKPSEAAEKSLVGDRGDTADTPFEQSLSFLLATVGNRIALIAERDVRGRLVISYMEWRVLQIVGSEPGAVPMRIVAITGVNKANVSRAATMLEVRGLIERASLEDRSRYTRLSLTEEGRAVYLRGNALRAASEEVILAGLGATRREVLGHELRQMIRNLDRAITAV